MFQQNGVQCPRCKDILYSNNRHDFVGCSCGALYIDGGYDYPRVGYDGIAFTDIIHVSRTVDRLTQPKWYRHELPTP